MGPTLSIALPSVLLAVSGSLAVALRNQARARRVAEAKQRTAEELAGQSELRFRILTRATNEAVWDWNLHTDNLWWNRNIETSFGYHEEEVGSEREWWKQHVHPEDRPAAFSSLQKRMGGHEDFWSAEYRFQRADGSYADVFDRGYILRDRDGRGVRMIGSIVDMTKQKREMELARTRDAALESARLKSQFLANMSHEIRTPMNSVIGMTDILLHTELTDEQREFVEIVRVSGESLLTIINDILDFSKLEAGKLKFEILDFEPRSTVEEVTVLLLDQLRAKPVKVSSWISPEVPMIIRGDPGRLRQVLTNLVSNAIKFTPQGEITIRVALVEQGDSQVTLRFEVTDAGIGIPEEARRYLFQPFSQADASTTRKYGGTGLGLAICKQLVTMMAGEIGCESASGKGSTFWFTARFEKAGVGASLPEASLAAIESATSAPPRLSNARRRNMRILVAEDNPFNQKVVLRQLREMGFGADAVGNGIEALEAMHRISYDLVLMDCQMPDMDGYACAAEIRRLEDGAKHVPVIAMTAHVMKDDRDKCLAAGMDDFLSKPVRVAHLEEVLTTWLGEQRAAGTGHCPTSDGTSPDPVDMDVLMEVAGNQPGQLQELANRYIDQTGGQLARLREAIAAGSMPEIKRLAHGMAGSSAMCGVTRVARLLREMERMAHGGQLAATPSLCEKIESEFERAKKFLSEVEPCNESLLLKMTN
jgi:PAS domain S-box-containing protein